ncbi:unnamed protein product [Lactuca saligna]|uniref:Uncharacterized protein n=1 Tax=Lactuca saligna TaxID=75948 RepID=A0AA36EJ25_LACSI|nr:unnamed protein product [Lactuca saligna]
MASTGISHIGTVKSKLTIQIIAMLVRMYHIDTKFHPWLSEAHDAIIDASEGFVGVYCVFFKSGLCLPTFDFLKTVSFSLRHGLVELCDGLPTSIKYWKEEFFFVHSFSFSGPMEYGAAVDRVVDPTLELSPDELLITNRLESNFVRWAVPDEVVLGMAGMSPHWSRLGKKPVEMFEGEKHNPYRLYSSKAQREP